MEIDIVRLPLPLRLPPEHKEAAYRPRPMGLSWNESLPGGARWQARPTRISWSGDHHNPDDGDGSSAKSPRFGLPADCSLFQLSPSIDTGNFKPVASTAH